MVKPQWINEKLWACHSTTIYSEPLGLNEAHCLALLLGSISTVLPTHMTLYLPAVYLHIHLALPKQKKLVSNLIYSTFMERILYAGPWKYREEWDLHVALLRVMNINDGAQGRKKGPGHVTAHFFPTQIISNICNCMLHLKLSIQKSALIIPFVSYFQANSQAGIEQHVLLYWKYKKEIRVHTHFAIHLQNLKFTINNFPHNYSGV